MLRIICSIFQILIITIGLQAQAGDLSNFSINYNGDSNISNYVDNYDEQEESRADKHIYELVTGKNLVTDDKLSEFDRTLALVGILSLGTSHYISSAGKALSKFKNITKTMTSNGSTIVNSAQKLFGKTVTKAEMNGFSNLSKQILRDDPNGIVKLDKIVVSPKFGNKYVKELPDLKGSIKEAFDGHVFKGSYKPGEVFFQAQRKGQTKPGRWFAPVKPINSEHAEAMLNIKKWGNNADKIKVYKVKESVSGYAGKVACGEGHQFLIPNDVPLEDVLEEIIF
ncbi:pre-toxin TG domain-containing protein [Halobacteriovorax sp.]|uniref:pre-toxin TG domain-containing protein n=1 Tax=Halobacteriovorax sp. TaxID=2020862 RepID=UPI003567AB19